MYTRRHAMVDAARVPEEAQAENHTAFRCVQQHTFIHPPHHFVQDGKLLRVL